MKAAAIYLVCFLAVCACEYLTGSVKTGDGTYYDDWKRTITACGKPVGQVGPHLCALSPKYMDVFEDGQPCYNPNTHPLCSGKSVCVLVWNASHGTVPPADALQLKVEDRCAGCKADDIDLADDVYEMIAPKAAGRVKVHWKFIPCNGSIPNPLAGVPPAMPIQSTTPSY